MKNLPPHITWPLLVVGLLVLGVTWSIGVVVASQSDGGAQVIENYYEEAISWDKKSALLKASARLGWNVSLATRPDQGSDPFPHLVVTFLDHNGKPITGLQGQMSASRPQSSKPARTFNFESALYEQGTYTLPFPEITDGLWDFEIDVEKDSTRFYSVIRKEFTR